MSHVAAVSRRSIMSDAKQYPNSKENDDADVVVIGGGIAGLAAAATVARAGRSVVVYESRNELGGQARTVERDGFSLNQGPHALYLGGEGERVLKDLGVRVEGGRPPVKGRLVFDGRAEIAPAGPITLMRTGALSLRDKVAIGSLLARLPKVDASALATTTVNDWIAQTVAGERPAEMVRSLVRLATYANHPDQLSADVAVSQLQLALGPGVLYLHGGWKTLVDQLRATPGVRVMSGERLHELPDARAVIVAVGDPTATATLVGRQFHCGPAAEVSCIDLGLARRPDHDVVIGGDVPFYFSNHSAVANMAPDGNWLTGSMHYLADGEEPDPVATEAFAEHAGVRPDDIVMKRRLHRMTASTAVPVARLGGMAGRPAATDTGHPNVFMAGDWVGPVGHLVDASLASAATAARAALDVCGRVGTR